MSRRIKELIAGAIVSVSILMFIWAVLGLAVSGVMYLILGANRIDFCPLCVVGVGSVLGAYVWLRVVVLSLTRRGKDK